MTRRSPSASWSPEGRGSPTGATGERPGGTGDTGDTAEAEGSTEAGRIGGYGGARGTRGKRSGSGRPGGLSEPASSCPPSGWPGRPPVGATPGRARQDRTAVARRVRARRAADIRASASGLAQGCAPSAVCRATIDALGAHQPPAAAQQERHRLAALPQIPQAAGGGRSWRDGRAGTARRPAAPSARQSRDDLGGEDALRDEQRGAADVERPRADPGAGRDVVHRDVGTPRAAQCLDRRDGGVRVPGQRAVPVGAAAVRQLRQRRVVALLVEVVEAQHGQAGAGGEGGLAGAGGAGQQDDAGGGRPGGGDWELTGTHCRGYWRPCRGTPGARGGSAIAASTTLRSQSITRMRLSRTALRTPSIHRQVAHGLPCTSQAQPCSAHAAARPGWSISAAGAALAAGGAATASAAPGRLGPRHRHRCRRLGTDRRAACTPRPAASARSRTSSWTRWPTPPSTRSPTPSSTQIADFKPVGTTLLTGALSNGGALKDLPLVGTLTRVLPG